MNRQNESFFFYLFEAIVETKPQKIQRSIEQNPKVRPSTGKRTPKEQEELNVTKFKNMIFEI